MAKFLSYLVVASPTLNLALTLGVVQDGARWTEAAFSHGRAADRAVLGKVRRILERRRRFNTLLSLFERPTTLTAAARVVDKWRDTEKSWDISRPENGFFRTTRSPVHWAEAVLPPVDADAAPRALSSISSDSLAGAFLSRPGAAQVLLTSGDVHDGIDDKVTFPEQIFVEDFEARIGLWWQR